MMERWLAAAAICAIVAVAPLRSGQAGEGAGQSAFRWSVDSSLNRLLDATLSVPADVRDVRLAPPDAYQAQGIQKPPFLPDLVIEHVVRKNYVAVSSLTPIDVSGFKILLLLDGRLHSLPVRLKKAAQPEKPPPKPPSPQRILEWVLNKLAADYGMERTTAWLELKRISTGALHDGSERRLILRLSGFRWSPDMIQGLRQLAETHELDIDFEAFDLLNEARLLRHLLNEGSAGIAYLRNMPDVSRQVKSLEMRLGEAQQQLEKERKLRRELAQNWWLQKNVWWFVAGGMLLLTVLLAFTRLSRQK